MPSFSTSVKQENDGRSRHSSTDSRHSSADSYDSEGSMPADDRIGQTTPIKVICVTLVRILGQADLGTLNFFMKVMKVVL